MIKEYLEHVSMELSEDIERFATETVFKESRYIFTEKRARGVYGYCTHCKTDFKSGKLSHNSKHVCPNCKSTCIVKDSWRGRKTLQDEACFLFYERSIRDPNVIVAKGFDAVRDYSADYRSVETSYGLIAIYIFGNGESIMLKRNQWWTAFKYKNEKRVGDWYKTSSVFSFNSGYLSKFDYECSYESIWNAVKNTPYRYSTYKKYLKGDMLKFFVLYTKHPFIEYLTKMGMKELIEVYLNNGQMFNCINWRGKDIYKVLKLSKVDLREISNNPKIKISPLFLKIYQYAVKEKPRLSVDEIKDLEDLISFNEFAFFEIIKSVPVRKACRYIKKQKKMHSDYWAGRYMNVISTWRDYISDCKKLNLDIKNERVIFPKNVAIAHENTTKQIKIEKNEKYDKKIFKRAEKLKYYEFHYKDLFIRPARSSIELIEEGTELGHCVATHYTETYASGNTIILLVRRINEPDKPYFTVEVRNGEVIQCQGKGKTYSNPEIKEFIEEFKKEKLNKGKSNTKIAV